MKKRRMKIAPKYSTEKKFQQTVYLTKESRKKVNKLKAYELAQGNHTSTSDVITKSIEMMYRVRLGRIVKKVNL